MLVSTSAFIESVGDWVDAIECGDLAAAKVASEHIRLRGELLAIHPEFANCLRAHQNPDAEAALQTISQFLACVTDCRARALRTVG